jgi:hypothetical protein
VAIKRRKQIWEALHPAGGRITPTSLHDGRKAGPQHAQQFAAETAAISGRSKQDINRHLSRGEALGDDLLKVAGTSLDKGACAHVCTRPSALLVEIRNQLEHPDQKAETARPPTSRSAISPQAQVAAH